VPHHPREIPDANENHVTGQFKKLRKLTLSSSVIFSAPSAHPTVSVLSITTLSINDNCGLQSPLDPACLPFVRSLTASIGIGIPFTAISPLLPRLTSLSLSGSTRRAAEQALLLSTSLKLLSLPLDTIVHLGLDTQAIIQERIEVLRIFIDNNSLTREQIVASAIIGGSRVMKKVIVDGSKSSIFGAAVGYTMTPLARLCKKANIEFSKENCKSGNSKVDSDSE
jgi:hypothetical protein